MQGDDAQHQGMMGAHAGYARDLDHADNARPGCLRGIRRSCRSSTLTRRPIGRRSVSKRCASIFRHERGHAEGRRRPERIDGGLEIAVTGTGRTLVAIQRMVPAWAQTMNGHQGWSTKAAFCRTESF